MPALRANRKTDEVQTPILDNCTCCGNLCCRLGRIRSVLFQPGPAHSDNRELMYSLWPGLFDLARNPRVSSRPDAATEEAAKALELAPEEQERISKEIKRTMKRYSDNMGEAKKRS